MYKICVKTLQTNQYAKQMSLATISQPLADELMNSAIRPQPWCLICLQPSLHHLVLNRFQRRHDAEAHLKVMQQIMPNSSYMVMFDEADLAEDAILA